MLVLTRKGMDVFHDDKKLTIVAQATKGPNQEVVKVAGLPGSNGQKWISLRTLKEGLNELQAKGREVTYSGKKYALTAEEQKKVDALQVQIDAIVDAAKARYVEKPSLTLDVSKLTLEQRKAEIAKLEKYYGL